MWKGHRVPAATMRRNSAGALLLILALLCVGACAKSDGGGVATAGESTPTADSSVGPPPAADERERARQYVACLRQQGVRVADPEAGKQIELDEDSPQDKQAAQACRQYLPTTINGRGGDTSGQREYAACMRRNGLPAFPDPDPDHGLQLPKSLMNDPNYAAADRTCGELAKPGAGGK
jgi:hypothetical protein